jgi:hypothetical protein
MKTTRTMHTDSERKNPTPFLRHSECDGAFPLPAYNAFSTCLFQRQCSAAWGKGKKIPSSSVTGFTTQNRSLTQEKENNKKLIFFFANQGENLTRVLCKGLPWGNRELPISRAPGARKIRNQESVS